MTTQQLQLLKHVPASPYHQVSMSNALVRSAHNLSLPEKRIIFLAISKLDPNMTEAEYVKKTGITITASDLATIFGDNGNMYNDMKEAAERLGERKITFIENTGGSKSYGWARWLQGIKYNDQSGSITLAFSVGDEFGVFKHLSQLTKSFTAYRLSEVGGLKSLYAWRLYEVMKSYAAMGVTTIDLSDLHNYLETNAASRKAYGDFKRWVLLPAIKAVNEHTDLNVSFNEIKTGRSVTAIAFKVKSDATKEAAKANRRHVNVIVVRQVAPPDDVKVPKLSAKQQKANAEAALAAAGYYSKKDADPIPF